MKECRRRRGRKEVGGAAWRADGEQPAEKQMTEQTEEKRDQQRVRLRMFTGGSGSTGSVETF